MKISRIYSVLVAASLLIAGCSKEDPFSSISEEKGAGSFSRSAIALDVKGESMVSTKANDDNLIDNFRISFRKDGVKETESPYVSYLYSEMPEIVTLPAGIYYLVAEYGGSYEGGANCGFEMPHYYGKSNNFEIKAGEITGDIGTIVCTLENVKVSIVFEKSLRDAMSEDSYVEVKVAHDVNNDAGLKFNKNHDDAGTSGYFAHKDGVSLAATFYGDVEGQKTATTKTYDVVNKGYHYKITFKLHNRDSEQQGAIAANLDVDASLEIVDITHDIQMKEEELLPDDERPREPNEGDDPAPGVSGPVISGEGEVSLTETNQGNYFSENGLPFVIKIESASDGGIQEFKVHIQSEKLNKDELITVGLDSDLDLVNPGAFAETLQNLGLLVKYDANGNKVLDSEGEPVPETSYEGYKLVKFDLSKFMGMLGALGPDEHEFILTVTDANGTTTQSIKIAF